MSNRKKLLLLLGSFILLSFQYAELKAQSKKEVKWCEATAIDFNSSEELAERTIYNDWKCTASLKSNPLLFFFFWPEDDKTSSDQDIKGYAEKSIEMEKILVLESVVEQTAKFVCIKVDLRLLRQWGSKGDAIAMKYRIRRAPTLVFYDRTGFPQGDIKDETTEDILREKMKFIATIGSLSKTSSKWVKLDALDFKDENQLKKRSVFEDWLQARELGEAKPMLFYFYWPVKDKKNKDADKNAKSQADKTEDMDKTLQDNSLDKQLERFYLFKVNLKELLGYGEEGRMYVGKYKVKKAPSIILYDYKGNQLMRLGHNISTSSLSKKLKYAADKSDKLLKK